MYSIAFHISPFWFHRTKKAILRVSIFCSRYRVSRIVAARNRHASSYSHEHHCSSAFVASTNALKAIVKGTLKPRGTWYIRKLAHASLRAGTTFWVKVGIYSDGGHARQAHSRGYCLGCHHVNKNLSHMDENHHLRCVFPSLCVPPQTVY